MQKKFVTNLALLLSLNLIIKGFYILVVEVGIQNRVGTENFGTYFALFNFSFLLNILLDVGITNFNNKNIAQNNHLLTKHFSSIVVLKLFLGIIYLGISLFIAFIIGYDLRLMKLFLYLGFNQFLISFVLYLRSNLAALHLFKTDSVMSVLDRSFLIILCSVLLWSSWAPETLDVMWFVYAQTISYALQALVVFIIVMSKTHSLKLKWSLPFSIMILKKSFPFAVLVLLMTFYNRVDTVMLERMLPNGAEQAGVYAQAYRILDSVNMIAFLFAGLLLPMFSRMLKHRESVEALVKLAFTLLITPAIVVATGCFFYSEELIGMLYKNHAHDSALVFRFLMMCFCAISTTYVFGTLLTANGNLRQLNMMACTGIVINIVLNIILIPNYQAEGTAVSSVVTQVITAVLQVLIVQQKFKFRINVRLISRLIIFVCGVIIINLFTKNLHPIWLVNFGVMVASSLAWSFLIGLISIKGARRIMKYG